MDYGIFNVRTDVNACNRARGCTNTVRESALKVDSAACWSGAPPTELHPHPGSVEAGGEGGVC